MKEASLDLFKDQLAKLHALKIGPNVYSHLLYVTSSILS